MGHVGLDQKAPEQGSAACHAPLAGHSSAVKAMPQAWDAGNVCHAAGQAQSSPHLSPSQDVDLAAYSCKERGYSVTDPFCPSPMTQPSPAPLRQRLGLDLQDFQPCRRMKLPQAASACLQQQSWEQDLEDVEVIEID